LFKKYRPGTISYEGIRLKEENIFYADSSFFNVFSYHLVKGDPTTVLHNVNAAMVEEGIAHTLFGSDDPLGKRIRVGSMDGIEEFEITGIFKNPENSHLQLKVVASFASIISLFGDEAHTSWGWYDFYTYLVLHPDASAESLESKLPDFVKKYDGEQDQAGMRLNMRKVSSIHLDSDLMMEARINGDRNTVYTLAVIGIVILLIAWINYIILATARALERAKEVGLRKTAGSSRFQLSVQFIIESVMLGLASATASVLMLYTFIIPTLTSKGAVWISLDVFREASFWITLLIVVFAGSVISGFYPAFVLSSFKPALVLKGSFRTSASGVKLRKMLIILQLISTVVLVMSILVVNKQVGFLNGLERGFNAENILIIKAPDIIEDRTRYAQSLETFKQSALGLSGVAAVSITSDVPGAPVGWYNGARRLSAEATYPPAIVYTMTVDDSFIETYQIRMKAGSFFSDVSANNSRAVVLNEVGIKSLGFQSSDEAIQSKIRMRGDTLQIIGVIENYYHESPKVALKPTVYLPVPEEKLYFSIRHNTMITPASVEVLRDAYAEVFPEALFDYSILNDSYQNQYHEEFTQLATFQIYAVVAVILACMGLFALTSYTVVQRVREIGVRKVLGSSNGQIFSQFTWETIRLALISTAIAIPIGIYFLNKWLEQFVNKTSIDAGIVIGTVAMTLVITVGAVIYNALRAARMNPIRSLRGD
jgi:putative ABC transport system permease protein